MFKHFEILREESSQEGLNYFVASNGRVPYKITTLVDFEKLSKERMTIIDYISNV